MTTMKLFGLWPAQLGRAIRRYRLMLAIRRMQMNIDYVSQSIADAMTLRSRLREDLRRLKAEQRSL